MGLTSFRPAWRGALPWIGSYRPDILMPVSGTPARLAEGSMPIEPASIEASSVRISPKVFSVTSVSRYLGFWIMRIEQASTSMCSKDTSG